MVNLDELLHWEVGHFNPSTERMAELISQGACVNGENHDGSLLWHCVGNRKLEACRTLIRLGADPNLEYLSQVIQYKTSDRDTPYPLHVAATRHDEAFALLLMAAGADKNLRNRDGLRAEDIARDLSNHSTHKAIVFALHMAAAFDLPEECVQLLELGFSAQLKDDSGKTPLDYTLGADSESCAQVLRSWMARQAALEIVRICKQEGTRP